MLALQTYSVLESGKVYCAKIRKTRVGVGVAYLLCPWSLPSLRCKDTKPQAWTLALQTHSVSLKLGFSLLLNFKGFARVRQRILGHSFRGDDHHSLWKHTSFCKGQLNLLKPWSDPFVSIYQNPLIERLQQSKRVTGWYTLSSRPVGRLLEKHMYRGWRVIALNWMTTEEAHVPYVRP